MHDNYTVRASGREQAGLVHHGFDPLTHAGAVLLSPGGGIDYSLGGHHRRGSGPQKPSVQDQVYQDRGCSEPGWCRCLPGAENVYVWTGGLFARRCWGWYAARGRGRGIYIWIGLVGSGFGPVAVELTGLSLAATTGLSGPVVESLNP